MAFVEDNGGEATVVNNVFQSDVACYPQGVIHYRQNLDCKPATFIAVLDTEDRGVVTITTRLFELPSEPIQVAIHAVRHSSVFGMDDGRT